MAQLQAIIQKIEPIDDAQIRVVAVVTDGEQKAERTIITASIDVLKSQLRNTLSDITKAADLKALHVGDVLDLSPPPPTPEQEARDAFIAARLKLRIALLQLADECGPTADDIAQLKKDAQALYKPDYLGIA